MQQYPFRPCKDPRPEIENALERAIELSTSTKRYIATDGQLVSEEYRRYRYRFTLESSWDIPDSTDLQLSSFDVDPPLLVQLSSTKGEIVTILTAQRLTERTLAMAQLVVDRSFLLRKMKEALDPLKTSRLPAQLGLKLFGHLDCLDETAASSLVDLISDIFVPDDAQRLAIQRALASELLMILGPPGTGKTDVLAAIALLHAMLYKSRVLICSHTNIAIDNAIIRLVKFLRNHGLEHWLSNQSVVRYGDPHLGELETDDYRNVTMPLIVAASIEWQREEIARLERRRERVHDQITKDKEDVSAQRQAWELRKKVIPRQRKRAVVDLEHLEAEECRRLTPILAQLNPLLEKEQQVQQRLEQAVATWHADAARLYPLQQTYQRHMNPYQTEQKKLNKLRTHPHFIRFFIQLFNDEWEKDLEMNLVRLAEPLKTLAGQIAPIQQHQIEAKDAHEEAEREREELEPSIAFWTRQRDARPADYDREKGELLKELADLDRELKMGNPRIAELEQAIEQGRQEVGLIENTLAHLDQQMADAKREAARKVVESAQVVGATLTALSMNPVLLNQEWDVVIIDEGSMAPPPAVLIAANRARAHLIIVGDPLQLAPVCTFQDSLVKYWLGRDVFHHGGYTLEQAAAAEHHSVLLLYQGRMDSQICDLIRGPIYKNRLKDRTPDRPRPKIGPEPDYPVVLYDTGGSSHACAEQPTSKRSRYNRYHAEVAIALAQLALADFPKEDRKPECIGIVTPYAAQRDMLKDLVRGTELEMLSRIGTVHAFQGLEFDALIFDLVESPGLAIAPFLKGGWGSEAMRLMNVAVTRARHKLLIVANMEYIRTEPQHSLLRQITDLACQKKCVPTTSLVT